MFWIEFKRIFLKAPILFTLFFIVPVFVISSLVVGIDEPAEPPENIDAALQDAELRLDSLYVTFGEYQDFADYKNDLLDYWIAFGGQTDDVSGDIYGAYHYFLIAEYTDTEVFFSAYHSAQSAFMAYYSEFQRIVLGAPKVFIKTADYKSLVRGTEGLYGYFSKDYETNTQLYAMRAECHKIRQKVNFRKIIAGTKSMVLTYEQSTGLYDKFSYINEKREQFARDSVEEKLRYIDFCEMSYRYLMLFFNKAVSKNTSISTGGFYGFSGLFTDKATAEIHRIEYLFEKNKTELDYAKPFVFMAVSHQPTGTTPYDFTYNCVFIIAAALALLAVFIPVFCIFDDIKKNTVIGSIVSPHSRRKIITAKIFAGFVAFLIAIKVLCAMYIVTSYILVGPVVTPPMLFVFANKFILAVSTLTCFLISVGVLLLKFLFLSALSAMLCLVLKRKITLLAVIITLSAAIITADRFLQPFTVYQLVMLPVIVIGSAVFLITAVRKFVRRDF
jgi:hypothetical protein